MRRTLRTLRGLYVYVGVLPARDFIGNIAESVGEPVALIHRSVREDPQPVTAPGPVLDQNIVRKGVGLPAATAITWQPDNPYRGGTASYARYELYKGASTIAEARSLGATPQDFKTGLLKGYGQL